MNTSCDSLEVKITATTNNCPIGERVGRQNMAEEKIPVLSCEGGCIRGEIARLAANEVAKESGYARGCHGELLTVPDSIISKWIRAANQVVLIDGCFLKCHGRILENLISKEKLAHFDALSVYKKYTDIFNIDDVPEEERRYAAQQVAKSVVTKLKKPKLEQINIQTEIIDFCHKRLRHGQDDGCTQSAIDNRLRVED